MTPQCGVTDEHVVAAFEAHMRARKLSPATVRSRLRALRCLAAWLPVPLLAAEPGHLERYQQSYAHLARATVDVYTRHLQAFYGWAVDSGRIAADPTNRMATVRARRRVPHPISEEDLRMVLACARGGLRLAYILAAFAGLRAGEITRLRAEDLTLAAECPVALIHGKGGYERLVPLLPPVVAELRAARLPKRARWCTAPAGRSPRRGSPSIPRGSCSRSGSSRPCIRCGTTSRPRLCN